MNKLKSLLIFFLLANPLLIFADTEKKIITIASGDIMKKYHEAAIKLCSFFEKSNPGLKCKILSTKGSVENLELLKANKADFIIAQSDIVVDAFGGIGYYANQNPRLELRQVLNLYDEIFTIITKDDDQIKIFADIAGKNVTHGPAISGAGVTYNMVRSVYSFKPPLEIELKPEIYAKKLCAGDIDAVILMVGHPNALVNHIANQCNVEFVGIETDKLAKLMEKNRAFKKVSLHKEMYRDISHNQETIAVTATLLTSANANGSIVKNFINYFRQNVKDFKTLDFIPKDLPNDYFTTDFLLPMHEKLMKKK